MKNNLQKNYLDIIFIPGKSITWKEEENLVILDVENKGFFNRIAQKLFKKPKISYIHLDKTGSFIWPLMDGEKTIIELGKEVDAHFGEEAHPLYERLAKYFQILDSYGFVKWANK